MTEDMNKRVEKLRSEMFPIPIDVDSDDAYFLLSVIDSLKEEHATDVMEYASLLVEIKELKGDLESLRRKQNIPK